MRAFTLTASLLLIGCGSNVRGPVGDASALVPADASPPMDLGPTACPQRVAPGIACAPGTRTCLGDDQCNDCFCTSGVWVCGSRVCVDAGVCPTGRPRTGDACASVGQVCSYGAGCAGAECLCAGGRWTCDAFFCSDP